MKHQFEILQITRANILNAIKDLSVKELNTIPTGFNNNIIWNVAHILVTQQILVYKLSNQNPTIPADLIDKYKKGSSASEPVSENEINEIKGLLSSTIKITEQDYNNNLFSGYTDYTTSYNITLRNAEEAITFNNIHEGLHLGYIMALKRVI